MEEEDHGEQRVEEEEEEEEDGTARIGRYLLRVRDSREENGFIVTDMEVQVHKYDSFTINRELIFTAILHFGLFKYNK